MGRRPWARIVGGEVQGDEGTCMHLGVAGRCDIGRNEWGFREGQWGFTGHEIQVRSFTRKQGSTGFVGVEENLTHWRTMNCTGNCNAGERSEWLKFLIRGFLYSTGSSKDTAGKGLLCWTDQSWTWKRMPGDGTSGKKNPQCDMWFGVKVCEYLVSWTHAHSHTHSQGHSHKHTLVPDIHFP